MIRRLIQRLSADATPMYECRRCGMKLEERTGACPECGSAEIARYEIGE